MTKEIVEKQEKQTSGWLEKCTMQSVRRLGFTILVVGVVCVNPTYKCSTLGGG